MMTSSSARQRHQEVLDAIETLSEWETPLFEMERFQGPGGEAYDRAPNPILEKDKEAETLKERIADKIEPLIEKYGEPEKILKSNLAIAKRKAKGWRHQSGKWMREHPISILLVGFGLAALAGRWFIPDLEPKRNVS